MAIFNSWSGDRSAAASDMMRLPLQVKIGNYSEKVWHHAHVYICIGKCYNKEEYLTN